MRHKTPRPTDAELEILQILWEQGPCTVKHVHEQISSRRSAGYTTILKLMQIMAEKRLVVRDRSQRSHVYSASREREQTQRQLLVDLITRAFGGSANQLVLQALQAERIEPDELQEIRDLLDNLEERP